MAGLAGPDGVSSISTASVVTKGSRGSSAAALTAALILGLLLAWLALSDDGPDGIESDVDNPSEAGLDVPQIGSIGDLADPPAVEFGPSPTVRWETPPKFGGHGDGYGADPDDRSWIRTGPYR